MKTHWRHRVVQGQEIVVHREQAVTAVDWQAQDIARVVLRTRARVIYPAICFGDRRDCRRGAAFFPDYHWLRWAREFPSAPCL